MTISEMLGQSGLLTLLGLGVVFAFIIILIFCMKLLQVLVHALKLDKGDSKATVKKAPAAPAATAVSAAKPAADAKAIVAVIAAAIREKESV